MRNEDSELLALLEQETAMQEDAYTQGDVLKDTAIASAMQQEEERRVQQITEPLMLADHFVNALQKRTPEEKPKNVLEQQVTWEGTKEITRGLLKSADEALIRE